MPVDTMPIRKFSRASATHSTAAAAAAAVKCPSRPYYIEDVRGEKSPPPITRACIVEIYTREPAPISLSLSLSLSRSLSFSHSYTLV